jgi:hypothetical protein
MKNFIILHKEKGVDFMFLKDLSRSLNPFGFEKVAADTTSTITSDQWRGVVAPIANLINNLLTPAMLIVVAIGGIYAIIVGVKFAKAEEQQDREKAKAQLKNAVIGFGLIFILIAGMRLAMNPLLNWVQSIVNNNQL